MSDEPNFDIEAAHRYFSTECFNRAWDLIDQENRTPADEDEMLNLSMASLWHWTQRPDCTKKELSLGYWQVSRIYAITGRPENAVWYAERCLEVTEDAGLPPFYLGYAYEALARAAMAGRNKRQAMEYIAQARALAAQEKNEEDKQLLIDDLETIL
ncbi:MAG: hypothetical protein ACM30E_02500 [Nitrososphaerales archaeon]